MQYIHTYATHNDYDLDDGKGYPNVGYVEGDDVVIYHMDEPSDDTWAKVHLTFEALEDGTFQFTSACTYSMDDGQTWSELAELTSTPTVLAGEKIMFKAENEPAGSHGCGTFLSTGEFNAMGNPLSMIYGDNFSGVTDLSERTDALARLFNGCTFLVSAENLSLPATALGMYEYRVMFQNCTSLTTPPQLPATTLAENCYYGMFSNCTSLTTAPALPATTLVSGCYNSMFQDCTSLTTAPALPATTLVTGCYNSMFKGCTSLTTPPQLPATTLASSCYYGMFSSCTSLTTPPQLPATALTSQGYYCMFSGCTSLTTAPALPATTLASSCYHSMFKGCTSLTTSPVLSAATLASSCYYGMFSGCTSLNYITMLATTASSSNMTNWVSSVAATGTFVKNASMTSLRAGTSGIPRNWTVVDAS